MQASGGLTSVEDAARRPILTLDSGPTGGILGCQYLGRLYGEENVICTDVGGTSFDVGLILRGEVPTDSEPVVSQYVMRIPKVAVHSIGAGGGCSAWIDEGGLLRVGPQSAGSRPGPACYGQGGDRADGDRRRPRARLPQPGRVPRRADGARRDLALEALAKLGGPLGMEPEEVAIGVFRIINAHMADLIRKSTIEQGHDPRECVLVAYGGAGPTHAAFYGHDIGSKAILVLADSTVFSAEGMLTCDITHTEQASHQLMTPLGAEDLAAMTGHFSTLESRVLDQFAARGRPRRGRRAGADRSASATGCRSTRSTSRSIPARSTSATPASCCARASPSATATSTARARCSAAGRWSSSCTASSAPARSSPSRSDARELGDADASAALKGEREAYFEPEGSDPRRSTTATRCARQPSSPARRSCSGWATASSSRPTTTRSSTAT